MLGKKTMKFEIVTLEKVVLQEEILQATIPTQMGEITVLPEHISLVSILKPGVIEIKKANEEIDFISLAGGFIEILPDKLVILADEAERAAELDEERIKAARQAAEEAREKALSSDTYDFSAVAAKLESELAKEKALRKWRHLKKM